jgi:hypothetical protein
MTGQRRLLTRHATPAKSRDRAPCPRFVSAASAAPSRRRRRRIGVRGPRPLPKRGDLRIITETRKTQPGDSSPRGAGAVSQPVLWSRLRVVTIGDRLGGTPRTSLRHSGIRIYSRPSEAAGKLAEAPHTLPGPGGAVTPASNDADFSGLTVVDGHSAMAILLDDRLRFAMAIAMPAAKRPPPRRECTQQGPSSHPPAKPRGRDHVRHRRPGTRCNAPRTLAGIIEDARGPCVATSANLGSRHGAATPPEPTWDGPA